VAAKLDSLKKWTMATYKTTKHSVYEQLGKVERTVDKDLEGRIEGLRDLHRRYKEVLSSAHAFSDNFNRSNTMQRSLAESLYQLSLKEDHLKSELSVNESMRSLCHNGDILQRSMAQFISSLQTLCNKTFEDTLLTINAHEQARLEFDVSRHELILLQQNPNANAVSLAETEQKCNAQKQTYEQFKEDVRVKITLLEEHRIVQIRAQLQLLQQALAAYYSTNAKALEETTGERHGLDEAPAYGANDVVRQSFLEKP
jgi:DNA-binding transcriptional regulator YiaG